MHLWARARSTGQQLTIQQCYIGEYHEVTHASAGLCAPGEALIRHFFLSVSAAESNYKLSWRQQNVGATVGALDATMKRGSGLTNLKIRQTLWSNDIQAPLVAVFVNSASMEDPAFTSACNDYNAVVLRCGMEPMRLLYLDCPFRDGPGAVRRLPSLTRPSTDAELDFQSDTGSAPSLIATVADCDAWVNLFDGESRVELGLDVEWRAPQRKGDTQGAVATLQLVSLRRGGVERRTGAIFCLTQLQVLPPSLIALLGRAHVAGVGVQNDLNLLQQDRLPSPGPTQLLTAGVIELSTLAHDVLRLPNSHVASLEKVLARCCPGRSLNKRLVNVRRYDWEEWPLQLDAQRYAINDAYASALAQRRLVHPDRRAPPPAAQPPGAAPPVDVDDAGAQLLDEMDGELHAQLFGDPDPSGSTDQPTSDLPRVKPVVMQTVLQAAAELIRQWDASGDMAPLELPTFLTLDDRASLHSFCEHRNLAHETKGDTGDERLIVSRRSGSGATTDGADGDAEVAGVGGDIMAALAFDEAWESGLIKYDPRHWMGNWFLMAQSKSSTLFKYFCVATSDAIFQVWEGDASMAGTREHVKAHLRKRYKHGAGVDMSDASAKAAEDKRVDQLIKRVRRGYWRLHCRFSIAPPRALARRLLSVYYFFREMNDPETGRPFFSSGHEKICRRELGYVAKGELSDHPSIPLYVELRRTATGLVISRCLRTSSGLEGYHQHLENAVSKCAKSAGLQYTEAMTNEFDWRWTVRAVRTAGLIPSWVRHYNLALIEYLHDTATALLSADVAKRTMAGWRRTLLMERPLVRHGMHYGLEAQKLALARRGGGPEVEATEQLSGEAGWVAEHLGSPQRLRNRPTAADVDALLAAPHDATATELSSTAFERGLLMAPARAESLVETIEADEAARVALEEAGYRELQQQLRTRVAPPAVAEATLPQRGDDVQGGAALPGPQPGMAPQVVEAAELDEMEDGEDIQGDADDDDDAAAHDVGAGEQRGVRGTQAASRRAQKRARCEERERLGLKPRGHQQSTLSPESKRLKRAEDKKRSKQKRKQDKAREAEQQRAAAENAPPHSPMLDRLAAAAAWAFGS